jgi:hypothetical protein
MYKIIENETKITHPRPLPTKLSVIHIISQ